MKAALAVFALLTIGLLALVARQGKWGALGGAMTTQARTLIPLIVLAVLIAACVEVLVSQEWVARWFGDGAGVRGIGIAWIAGALTPGGGPIGLPLAATLASRGAALPSVLTYLTSMALLSLIRFPLEWGILGGRLTVARWASTCLVPPIVGLITLGLQRLTG